MKQVWYVLVGVLVGFVLAGAIFIVTRLPGGKPILFCTLFHCIETGLKISLNLVR